jgi:hypothetical protein
MSDLFLGLKQTAILTLTFLATDDTGIAKKMQLYEL